MLKFLKSNRVLKVLFALIPVNKDLNFKFTSKREMHCLVQFSLEKVFSIWQQLTENVSFI